MRLAVDATPCDRYPHSGIAKVIHHLYDSLAELEPNWDFVFLRRLDGGGLFPARPNVRCEVVDIRGTGLTSIDLWEQVRLPLAVVQFKADLLHCPGNSAPRWSPVPLVLHVHDTLPIDYYRDDPGVSEWAAALTQRCRRAAAIVTASEHAKTRLLQAFRADPSKVVVVPHAATLLDAPSSSNATPPVDGEDTPGVVLHFGSLKTHKNSRRVLEAWCRLPANTRDRWRLHVLVPNERTGAELAAHCTPDGIASVRFMPAVPEAQLPGIVATASVLCYPSLDEGFGLPILEAFAAGAAVITSATSSMPEVAGDAAEYCDPHDIDSLTAAFARLLGDDARRARFVRAGSMRLTHFSWRRSAEQMRDVFQRSLRGKARA